MGHLILHPQIFRSTVVRSVDTWKKFVSELPRDVHSRAEWQAYCFAGLILVPSEPLKEGLRKGLTEVVANVERFGEIVGDPNLNPSFVEKFIRDLVEEQLAKAFDVSTDVIHKRIELEYKDPQTLFRKKPS